MANKTRMRLFRKHLTRTFRDVMLLMGFILAGLIVLLGPLILADCTDNAAFLLLYAGYIIAGITIEAWNKSGRDLPLSEDEDPYEVY